MRTDHWVYGLLVAMFVTTPVEAGWNPIKDIKKLGRKIDEKVIRPTITKPLKDLKEEVIEEVTGTDKDDLIRETRAQYASSRRQLETTKVTINEEFAVAIREMDTAIADVEYIGIDPTRVRDENGDYINLVEKKAELVARRDSAIRAIDSNLSKLAQDETNAIRKIEKSYR